MEVEFDSKKLAKDCSEESRMRARWGPRCADVLRRRLAELAAAPSLDFLDPRKLPGPRCHELTADMKGRLSVDLVHPLRLIFRPKAPAPIREDGGLDWTRVTAVVVTEVKDTH